MAFAWVAVAVCAALVLWLGGADFASRETARVFGPIVRFFYPDVSPRELASLHHLLRKTTHVAEYALLGLLAYRAVRLTRATRLVASVALSLMLVLAVAAIDETRQAFSSERSGSPADVALDAGGALTVVALAAALGYRRRATRRAGRAGPAGAG